MKTSIQTPSTSAKASVLTLLKSLLILQFNRPTLAFHSSPSLSKRTNHHVIVPKHTLSSPYSSPFPSSTKLNNFFKNLLDSAFENDSNLSPDKSQQQLEGPNDVENDFTFYKNQNEKTSVQKKWLESQAKLSTASSSSSSNIASSTSSSSFSPSLSSSTKGAPLNPKLLPGTKWELSLYLTGIPDFDPNNSLFGSKVNISTRKDSNMAKDGFAIGADSLPSEPSTTCIIQFLEGGKCQIEEGSFTNSFDNGEWKLSDDGRMIRFSLDVKGYQRTVTTTGTIQNVYWSDRDDVARKSSATYSIGAGLVYGEAAIGYGSKPGVFVMAMGVGGLSGGDGPGGILKVEKKLGMFGVSSKLMACGKFSAEMIVDP